MNLKIIKITILLVQWPMGIIYDYYLLLYMHIEYADEMGFPVRYYQEDGLRFIPRGKEMFCDPVRGYQSTDEKIEKSGKRPSRPHGEARLHFIRS